MNYNFLYSLSAHQDLQQLIADNELINPADIENYCSCLDHCQIYFNNELIKISLGPDGQAYFHLAQSDEMSYFPIQSLMRWDLIRLPLQYAARNQGELPKVFDEIDAIKAVVRINYTPWQTLDISVSLPELSPAVEGREALPYAVKIEAGYHFVEQDDVQILEFVSFDTDNILMAINLYPEYSSLWASNKYLYEYSQLEYNLRQLLQNSDSLYDQYCQEGGSMIAGFDVAEGAKGINRAVRVVYDLLVQQLPVNYVREEDCKELRLLRTVVERSQALFNQCYPVRSRVAIKAYQRLITAIDELSHHDILWHDVKSSVAVMRHLVEEYCSSVKELFSGTPELAHTSSPLRTSGELKQLDAKKQKIVAKMILFKAKIKEMPNEASQDIGPTSPAVLGL